MFTVADTTGRLHGALQLTNAAQLLPPSAPGENRQVRQPEGLVTASPLPMSLPSKVSFAKA